MGDLISRKDLLNAMNNVGNNAYTVPMMKQLVEDANTAYDVDKVVKRIKENTREKCACEFKCDDCVVRHSCGILEAIEIVKSGGIE